MDFTGKKVVVMGLGILGGGVGTARFFAKHGADVLVTDLKSEKELKDSIAALKEFTAIQFVLGQHREEDFINADLIIKNPSVPSSSPFVKLALSNNIQVEIAESLFMKLTPSPNVIGVTGTRGKSTTSQMIYEILKAVGKKAVLGGNVPGIATLELLDKIDQDYFIVLELSSWMLEGFGWSSISPRFAVVTNIYPDHLNRYTGMDEYVSDKRNIYRYQTEEDYLFLNKDNSYSEQFAKEAKSKIIWFSKKDIHHLSPLKISGEHNRYNAAASYAVAKVLTIDETKTIDLLKKYKGLPHRLEPVAEINGVSYINDSASTTPIAAVTALNSFSDKNIILITGGNSKNLPMEEFIEKVRKQVKTIILYEGTASDHFMSFTNKIGPFKLGEFDGAVKAASENAKPGDIVLFSPGLTHLPIINEFERGDNYKKAVKRLQKENSPH